MIAFRLQTLCCCALLLGAGACAANSATPAASTSPAGLCDGWVDHPDNPLIEAPAPEWLIADPSVLLPAQTPDQRWHLFANSFFGIHHYASDNGIDWQKQRGPAPLFPGTRPWVILNDKQYYMFYELYEGGVNSTMQLRTSANLDTWGEPQTLLKPELPWEIQNNPTIGNPFVEKRGSGFVLYYSASTTQQEDTGFYEPLYLGIAYANSLTGPWVKRKQPLMGRDSDNPWRNQGAGSIKLLAESRNGKRLAFNNWIYTDADGRSRSAIHLLASEDGENWQEICPAPVIKPEGNAWKSAFVYAFDVKRVGNELWMYYNARDGWAEGSERIGLATLTVSKLLDDTPLFTP